MAHIDEWLDTPTLDDGEIYARFVLDFARMPAWKKIQYERWTKQYPLFCTYASRRYRCTGASRLGDVWLTEDFEKEQGYDWRVDVEECSDWGDTPLTRVQI